MIHYDYNVCTDKDKYCAILWASGNYCGRLDLVITLAHRAIDWETGLVYDDSPNRLLKEKHIEVISQSRTSADAKRTNQGPVPTGPLLLQ